MFFTVVGVPELAYDEKFFTLDEAFINSAFNTLTGLQLITVVGS